MATSIWCLGGVAFDSIMLKWVLYYRIGTEIRQVAYHLHFFELYNENRKRRFLRISATGRIFFSCASTNMGARNRDESAKKYPGIDFFL